MFIAFESTISALLAGSVIIGVAVFQEQLKKLGKELWKKNKKEIKKKFIK